MSTFVHLRMLYQSMTACGIVAAYIDDRSVSTTSEIDLVTCVLCQGRIVCDEPGCQISIADNRWSKTRATGWFMTKAGEAWCPEHVPAWVAMWRSKRSLTT